MIGFWWIFFHIVWCNAGPLARRTTQDYVKLSLIYSSNEGMYYVNGLSLGSPAQLLEYVVLDTGSADLVLSELSFNSEKSTSFVDSGTEYAMEYGSTETITMNKAFDVLEGSSWEVSNYTIFIAETSTIDSFGGVVGIGYASLEIADQYANIPLAFQNAGLTQSTLYSIDGRESSANVIFGGIDKNAFVAPLYKTPIVYEVGARSTRSYYNVLAVTVNSVYLNENVVSSEKLMYTVDSGSNALVVTEPILNNIETMLGSSQTQDNTTFYKLDFVAKASLTFDITGIFVTFPLSDLIDETVTIEGSQHVSLRIITVGIGLDSYEGTIPNALLKSHYAVFDLDNNQILLANYSSSTTAAIVAVTGTSFAVSTKTAPNYHDIYTSMYEDASETTISTTDTSLKSTITSATPSSRGSPETSVSSPNDSTRSRSQIVIQTTSTSPGISTAPTTDPTTSSTTLTTTSSTSAANKVCKIKNSSK